ncbi:hypothetical protein S83_040344 [Arachis hypogaea]|uniref:KIB1-4 beta-propeller domain-containing protein n=1 Tax=Arachis hypogaea TaxID=3818 RepID=A0A445E7M9_ARAHY|nr:hypothetical protein Ahy_A02g005699 [Arachis hypogaea]
MFNIFHYEWATGQSFSELSFFNPFSRARFKLPKLFLFSREPCYYQVRVAFNSAPLGSEEFVVAFLCVVSHQENKKQRLAFIKLKQGSWIESIETDEIFYDIEVHDDNKLYGLTFKHGTSVVFVFTLGDNHRDNHVVERLVMLNTIQDTDALGRFIFSYASFKRSHQMVMDTSTGELLIVRHDLNASVRNGCYDSIRTKGFSVFKLDRSNLRWCEVFDIGDRFLFWDFTKVSLVSAKGLRLAEQFKSGNCIFFSHASTSQQCPGSQIQEHDMGVFFLADKTISRFSISFSLPFSLLNMWFNAVP